MSKQPGEKIPDITLFDTDKKKVSLVDLRGKNVVILFFPFAFSSTCTKELCEMQENYTAYEKMNAVILGISVDSLYTNAEFRKKYNLSFPVLSDFNKTVSPLYDSLQEDWNFGYHGVSKRSSFVIDKEGIVKFIEILPKPGDYPDMNAIRKTIASLS